MGMGVGGSQGGVRSDINMTPMIDVLLVLIIIFMVITPLVPKGLDTMVPQPNPNKDTKQQEPDTRTVVVSINAERQLKINQDAVTIEQLGPRLVDIFKTRAERTVFIQGDPEVLFSDVATIIDIATGSGIDKIGLMTEQASQ